MYHPFSGGAEPVSYTTASRTGPGDRLAETDSFLVSSPAGQEQTQQVPAPGSLCSAACHPLPQRHAATAQSPDNYVLVCPGQPYLLMKSEQQVWPSPPLAPRDFEQHTFSHCSQDSPTSAGGAFLPNYTCSPATPGTWSPVEQAALLQPACKLRRRQPLADQQGFMGMCTPTSTNEGSVRSGIASPFPDGGVHGFDSSLPRLPLGLALEPFDAETLSPEELLIGTPASMVTPKAESPPNCLNDVPEACAGASPPPLAHMDEQMPEAKLDEPYAKLMYRAFMSRPNYAMTLQDIYQWFRDNTNKAVSEKGGWQNSIRHNLSMNAAFTKRQCRDDDGAFATEDAKRANEWVLEDWAVRYGVQSTTRYRKGSSRRRATARSASQTPRQPAQYSAKRAVSGRKGGCAARDSRLRDRAYGHGLLSPPRSAMPELYYSAESFAMQQLGPSVCSPSGQHGVDDEGLGTEPFGLVMDRAMAGFHGHCGFTSVPCGDQMPAAAYSSPVQSSFPCGIRDMAFGYDGEQRVTDTGRLLDSMPDGIYDWTDSSM